MSGVQETVRTFMLYILRIWAPQDLIAITDVKLDE